MKIPYRVPSRAALGLYYYTITELLSGTTLERRDNVLNDWIIQRIKVAIRKKRRD